MQEKTISDRATIRHLWHIFMRRRRLFALTLLAPLGAIAMNIAVPFYIGKIFATLGRPHGDPYHYLLPLLIASIVGIVANRIGFVRLMAFQARTMSDMQTEALRVLLARSVGFHNNRIGGKLVSDAMDYSDAFLQLSSALVVNIGSFALVLLIGIGVVMYSSVILGLALLVIVAVTLTWAFVESRTRSQLRSQRLLASKAVTAHLSDAIVNAQTVKTFAHEDEELARHRGLNSRLLELRLHDWQRSARSGNNRISALLLMQLAFIVLTIQLVHHNPALLAIGIFAFTYTLTLTNRLFEINTMTRTVEEALLRAAPMTEIMLSQPEIRDRRGAVDIKVTKGSIQFSDVSFSYEDAKNKDVFAQLNLAAAPGEKIGLVGPSGGGKSTFTRLLLRFEDLDGGAITIDDQNIADVTQHSLRAKISYVPQEPLLFHRSINENIGYGDMRASQAAIEDAARKANAHDFIMELPHGYDTIVGERGVKLSGGQRQRIAIARAILKNAPIIVLDEATSALDSESELLIQEALWKLMEGRTAIVIAHRLSTIQKMDRIIVMEHGSVVEEGTHAELIAQKGLYQRLWKHQSGGFLKS